MRVKNDRIPMRADKRTDERYMVTIVSWRISESGEVWFGIEEEWN